MTEPKDWLKELKEVTANLLKGGYISYEYRDLLLGVVENLEAENARLKQQNEGLLTWAKQFKEERDRLEQELVALSGEK